MIKSINSHFFSNIPYIQIIILFIILPVIASGGMPNLVLHGAKGARSLKAAGSPPDVTKINEWIQKGADAYKKESLLDRSDADAQADYNPPGMPTMPITCENMKNRDCAACYEDAYKKLNDLRRYFEQLRAVYVETDEFTKASVAFGDSIAGSVGVGGLEWVGQRRKIQNSFKQFKKAYKRKYNELLGRLEEALQEIAECEKKYFGNEDWYSRYGFVFVSFMALHYAR